MSGAKRFLFGLLAGGLLMYFALQFHLVKSTEGLFLVPRSPRATLNLAWADTRLWSADDWLQHPELAQALRKHGAADLIGGAANDDGSTPGINFDDTVDELSDPGESLDGYNGYDPFAEQRRMETMRFAPRLREQRLREQRRRLKADERRSDASTYPVRSQSGQSRGALSFPRESQSEPALAGNIHTGIPRVDANHRDDRRPRAGRSLELDRLMFESDTEMRMTSDNFSPFEP